MRHEVRCSQNFRVIQLARDNHCRNLYFLEPVRRRGIQRLQRLHVCPQVGLVCHRCTVHLCRALPHPGIDLLGFPEHAIYPYLNLQVRRSLQIILLERGEHFQQPRRWLPLHFKTTRSG